MTLKLPALDPMAVSEAKGSGYPEPFHSRMGDRGRRRLGNVCGLTKLGVNLVTLGPGAQSALRHWHTLEEEFVYILSGEVLLHSDGGEQVLRAGTCAGFPAGKRDGHHLVNRSSEPVQYLELGNRIDGDNAFYPDDDFVWVELDGETQMAHRDMKLYPRRT